MHPVPLVHGLTVGEYAGMLNGEKWLEGGVQCDLEVIRIKGYHHNSLYKVPVRPSPNLPTMESIYLYPSLGLFEGTNVSVGRGTPKPFEWIGRPGLIQGKVKYTPVKIPGVADEPKYENIECNGLLLTDFCNQYLLESKQVYLEWLILMFKSNLPGDKPFFIESSFDRLAGSDVLRKQVIEGLNSQQIRETWQKDLESFGKIRSKYLLYN